LLSAVMPLPVKVNSRRWGKQIHCEVRVTRVIIRDVFCAAVNGPFAGTLPQRKFPDQFQPVLVRKKKR